MEVGTRVCTWQLGRERRRASEDFVWRAVEGFMWRAVNDFTLFSPLRVVRSSTE